MDTPLNWSQLGAHFADEQKARLLLEQMRWPNGGPSCPICGKTETVYRMQKRADSKKPGRPGLLRCRACKKQFTVTTGTVFEDTHIPMTKWLQAIYLLCSSKKGISAHQLHRMLGLTYKAAWFMAHRLRYAMSVEPMASKLAARADKLSGVFTDWQELTEASLLGDVEEYRNRLLERERLGRQIAVAQERLKLLAALVRLHGADCQLPWERA